MTFISTELIFPVVSLILGLILGSFYNVCIYRYLKGESIVSPASHCPSCGHTLSWWENLPLLSFILLKGHCLNCQANISWQYPFVESISGLWALLLAFSFGLGWPWLVYLLFGGLLIVLSFIDLDSFVLPDFLTIPGGIAAFLCAVFLLDMNWQTSLLGGLGGAGCFWIIQKFYKLLRGFEGLGSGDIKLMFLLGALLGWQPLAFVVLIGSISGLIVGIICLYKGKKHEGMQTAIPFGPFLSLGGMIYILYGSELMQIYMK